MRSDSKPREELTAELKCLIDSDFWKYLSFDARNNVLKMLAEYQSEDMRSSADSYGIWRESPY